MALLFLFVFATHAPYFAWRYARTRELRHAATALTLGLLAVAWALRIFAPELSLAGFELHRAVRAAALAAALVSLTLFARHHARRLRSGSRLVR
jgi:hypothetical protein